MGILNVTPDSFSDGGAFLDPQAAIDHGLALVAAGADLVDVGGESTRPGAARVTAAEECRRVLPVVSALAERGVTVSIDTTRVSVADAALEAGAMLVNDVSGGRNDPALPVLVGARRVPYVVMHSRGDSADMTAAASYADVVAEVSTELGGALAAVVSAGVARQLVVLDPGLGFHKTAAHNWSLLAHLDALATLGRPLLVGASRKSFLGSLLAGTQGPRPVGDRDAATHAVTALCSGAGVWAVRVHDVAPSADAVRVAAAWRGAR